MCAHKILHKCVCIHPVCATGEQRGCNAEYSAKEQIMRYTYHWTENGKQFKKTVRSYRGKILYKVQEKCSDTKWKQSEDWEYSLGYGRTWISHNWVVADAHDLDLGIWGV